ncbi:hypothetical protein [Teredinibacter turnerae]|uniref:hypothetical protein n=1 Tax=Teredinibacter turnerae TaxID=2426 RepID=UPI000402189B|nr:hypothetical protein [Teredinibacter turnerae]
MKQSATFSRLLLTTALVIFSQTTSAFPKPFGKPVNPGDYDYVKTKFRGENQEAARLKVVKSLERAQMDDRRMRVYVPPTIDNSDVDLGEIVSRNLTKVAFESGVDIIDSGLPVTLRKKLTSYEKNQQPVAADADEADFIITSKLVSANASKEFDSDSERLESGLKGKPGCEVKIHLTLDLKLYSLDPLQLDEAFFIDHEFENFYEGVTSCDTVTTDLTFKEAIASALDRNAAEIKNAFAPKGLIVDHRVKKKKHIFKTSFSARKGAAANAEVAVYKFVKTHDPITLKAREEKVLLGTGKILNATDPDNVWIQLDKKADASKVRLGDVVEVQHENCSNFSFNPEKNCFVKEKVLADKF